MLSTVITVYTGISWLIPDNEVLLLELPHGSIKFLYIEDCALIRIQSCV